MTWHGTTRHLPAHVDPRDLSVEPADHRLLVLAPQEDLVRCFPCSAAVRSRFDVLHFVAGNARLVDSSGDDVADALSGGVWTTRMCYAKA
jgi:hypothetical protein